MKKLGNRESTILLYVFRSLNIVIKFCTVIFITRKLNDPVLFGKYSFYISLNMYLAFFFGFGFDSVINRLMAISDEERSRGLAGVMYLVNTGFSVIFIFVMLLLSRFFLKGYSYILLLAILSQSFLFNDIMFRMQMGAKRISGMIITETGINAVILLFSVLFNMQYYGYLIVYYAAYLVVNNLVFFLGFKPVFTNLRENFQIIWKEVRSYGLNAYFGKMASLGTYNMDKLILERTASVEYVGYYNLGLNCISPIQLFSVVLMSVVFKDISQQNKIPTRILLINLVWLIVTSVTLAWVGAPIFLFFFGSKYAMTAQLFPLFALSAFLAGFFQPFNSFFSARGEGLALRNLGLNLSVANLIFNFILIPKFKLAGALYATILAQTVNAIGYVFYYYKLGYLKNNLSRGTLNKG